MTTASHDVFWWLLALLAVLVVAFAVHLGFRLARRARDERLGKARADDATGGPPGLD